MNVDLHQSLRAFNLFFFSITFSVLSYGTAFFCQALHLYFQFSQFTKNSLPLVKTEMHEL